MRKIAVYNRKGGCGKSTTAVSLAHGLALEGYRTLLVDCDSQGHATISLGIKFNNTFYDVLVGQIEAHQAIVPARDNLDLIPSDSQLAKAIIGLAGERKRETVLARRLGGLDGRYDYIVLDCSPNDGVMEENVIYYSALLVIPTLPEFLSIVGIKDVLNTMILPVNEDIEVLQILTTQYDSRNNEHVESYRAIVGSFKDKATVVIPQRIKVAEAPRAGQTVFEYCPTLDATERYKELVAKVVAHG